jgi:hypothetical protein
MELQHENTDMDMKKKEGTSNGIVMWGGLG